MGVGDFLDVGVGDGVAVILASRVAVRPGINLLNLERRLLAIRPLEATTITSKIIAKMRNINRLEVIGKSRPIIDYMR